MTAAPQVTGVKEALKTLRQIDPEMRKQFTSDAKQIAAPAINAGQSRYNSTTLPSGMARSWAVGGRRLLPADISRMARGVKLKIDTRARANSVIKISNTDGAATIIEWAGVKTRNRLAMALDKKLRVDSPRLLWPAVERELPQIRDGLEDALKKVEQELNDRLR